MGSTLPLAVYGVLQAKENSPCLYVAWVLITNDTQRPLRKSNSVTYQKYYRHTCTDNVYKYSYIQYVPLARLANNLRFFPGRCRSRQARALEQGDYDIPPVQGLQYLYIVQYFALYT